MKYSVIVFMILAALYRGANNDGFKDGQKQLVDQSKFTEEGANHETTYVLDADIVNDVWNNHIKDKQDGKRSYTLKKPEMGNGHIEFNGPSKNLMKVTVYVEHPYKEDETIIGFEGTYKWVEQLDRLVPTNCTPKDAPAPESTTIQTECIEGVKTASEVIQVAVSAQLTDQDGDQIEDVANCIKTRVIKTTQTEREKCMVTALDQSLRGYKEAIKEKLDNLVGQGYECNYETYECHKQKPEFQTGQNQTETLENKELNKA